MADVTLDTRGLDKMLKSLKGDLPKVKVGILGGKNARKDSGTNAEIGAKHEFGSAEVPQRSFLRIPLSEHLEEFMERNGAFDKEAFTEVMATGSLVEWMKKIGITAEQVVQEGFATGGFGKWKAWSGGYRSRTGNILVDTAQLRNSITSKVE